MKPSCRHLTNPWQPSSLTPVSGSHAPRQETPKLRLERIQVCRGAAAMLVLLFHCSQLSQQKLNQSLWGNAFVFGSAGVDFFFVLSGFIIFFVHAADIGQSNRLKPFLIKRLIRIYPFYWLITIALLPLYFLIPTLGYGYERNFDVILKSLLLIPQAHFPVLIVGWSLSYELLFYCLFALAICLPRRVLIRVIAGWLAGISLVFLGDWLGLYPERYFLIYFLFNPHNLEFIFGCVAAYLVKQLRYPINGYLLLILGVVSFGVSGYLHVQQSLLIQPALAYGVPSMLIVLGAAAWDLQPRSHPVPRCFSYLGDASYSIYLVHYPCLSLLFKLAAFVGLFQWLGSGLAMSLLIAITLSVGCLTYAYVEKPLVDRLRRQFVASKSPNPPRALP